MYVISTYPMNEKRDNNSKKFLDDLLYQTTANVDLLKDMLAHKANPNIENSYGNTPLHLAALNRYPQYLAILLDAGAKPNKPNNSGTTLCIVQQ